jgi:DNA-directed RNA polymerase specialized sigma24 family protein
MAAEPTGSMGAFPPTHWPAVFRAAETGRDAIAALDALLRQYLPALRAHLVLGKWGFDRDRADDLLQGFVADKIVESRLLKHLTGRGGRFRSYLLRSLDNYVIDHLRRSPPAQSPVSVENLDPADTALAGRECDPFDVAWARQVLEEALRRMQAECNASGREDVWGVFVGRTLGPTLNGARTLGYGRLIQRFGFRSPAQAANVLVTGKRMFKRALLAVTGSYAASPTEADEEVAELRRILSEARA